MKKVNPLLLVISFVFISLLVVGQAERKTMSIGSIAPDFSLPATDGRTYSLQSFSSAKILVIIFTCNHCPTAQAYEDRIIQLTKDYSDKGVQIVAINPNHPESLRLDELGWSDVGDSFDDMKVRAREKNFNFPYLFDGEKEIVSNLFGPVSTPHVFIFDQNRKLRYNGRIDDQENFRKTATSFDTRNALDAMLSGKEVPVTVTKVFGCSVKWAEKIDWMDKATKAWAKEPVTVSAIDVAGVSEILKNNTGKLRLITIWATSCRPCASEIPRLVSINRMYRDRDFELVTISADDPASKEQVLGFLKDNQASSTNYIFRLNDKDKLMQVVDPKWQGTLPYTALVEPGGKIAWVHPGATDPEELKQIIFHDDFMGRLFK
jgi:thiol-disulfide isomerase/thioredoxin